MIFQLIYMVIFNDRKSTSTHNMNRRNANHCLVSMYCQLNNIACRFIRLSGLTRFSVMGESTHKFVKESDNSVAKLSLIFSY